MDLVNFLPSCFSYPSCTPLNNLVVFSPPSPSLLREDLSTFFDIIGVKGNAFSYQDWVHRAPLFLILDQPLLLLDITKCYTFTMKNCKFLEKGYMSIHKGRACSSMFSLETWAVCVMVQCDMCMVCMCVMCAQCVLVAKNIAQIKFCIIVLLWICNFLLKISPL